MILNIVKAIGRLFRGSKVFEISADEALEKLYQSEALIFIDVRSPADFRRGHIPGAISLPLTEVESGFEQLDPAKAVIVY
jgi:rhodanese-related sulfurtransferase